MRWDCIKLSCIFQATRALTTLRKETFKCSRNYDHFLSEWNKLSFAWTKKQRYLTAAYHSLLLKISEEYEVWAALRAESSSSSLGIYSGHSTNPDDISIPYLWAAQHAKTILKVKRNPHPHSQAVPIPGYASAASLFWQLKARSWSQMRNILDFLLMTMLSSQLKQLHKGLKPEPPPCTSVARMLTSSICSIRLFNFYEDLFWTKLWMSWICKIW